MTTALLAALLVRSLVERRAKNLASTGAVAVTMAVILLAGWWTSGLFIVPFEGFQYFGAGILALVIAAIVTGSSMMRVGITLYSMNLLGPVMPQGWSALLPEIPIG